VNCRDISSLVLSKTFVSSDGGYTPSINVTINLVMRNVSNRCERIFNEIVLLKQRNHVVSQKLSEMWTKVIILCPSYVPTKYSSPSICLLSEGMLFPDLWVARSPLTFV
jgi:hypothetical protein